MQKFSKGHNSGKNFRIFSKGYQVIYSSSPISILNFNIIAQIVFEISAYKISLQLFSKGHNSRKGNNRDKKKIQDNYFFMRNPYLKFPKPCMNGSKVMLCTNKRDLWIDKPYQLL